MLKNGKRKGSALLLVVLVFMVISVLSTLMVITLDNTLFEVTTYATQMQASYMNQEAQEAAVAALMDRERNSYDAVKYTDVKSLVEKLADEIEDKLLTEKTVETSVGKYPKGNGVVGYNLGYGEEREEVTGKLVRSARGEYDKYGSDEGKEKVVPLTGNGKKILQEEIKKYYHYDENINGEVFDHDYTTKDGQKKFVGRSSIRVDVIPAMYSADAENSSVEAWLWVRVTTEVVDRRAFSGEKAKNNSMAGYEPKNYEEFKKMNHFSYEGSVLILCKNPVVQLYNMSPDAVNKIAAEGSKI